MSSLIRLFGCVVRFLFCLDRSSTRIFGKRLCLAVSESLRFGVKLRAHASGLHVIRVDIDSEVNPIVGTEQQSEALVQSLMDTFAQDPAAIWQTNVFGKSLYDLVREGMAGKIESMPDAVQQKMQSTLQRIVNEGCTNLICIML